MVTIRADGSFLQVNPTFCTMLGYGESKLLRMKLAEIVHFEHQAKIEHWLREARSGTIRHVEAEYRFVRNDMNFLWGHCTSVWQFDDKHRPTHSVMLIQDITERKRAEIELDQSRRRYQALVHSIDGIVWEADANAFHFIGSVGMDQSPDLSYKAHSMDWHVERVPKDANGRPIV